jgi:hypothetical protein
VPQAERRPRKRDPERRGRRRLLVVTGGITESNYLTGILRANEASSAVTQRVRAQDPSSLVEYAARVSGHREAAYDEVWCIVDVDDFDVPAAAAIAARRGIELAVSNPCFELWLLLHFEDCTAHLDGYPAAAQRLRRHVRMYDKARLNFADFARGVPAAVKRAKGLGTEGNPSTGVWRLVERVME